MKGMRVAGELLLSVIGIPPILATIAISFGIVAVWFLIVGVVALAIAVSLFLYLGVLPWIRGGTASVVAAAVILFGAVDGLLIEPTAGDVALGALAGVAIAAGALLIVGVLISLKLGGRRGISIASAWSRGVLGRLFKAVAAPTAAATGWLITRHPTILALVFWPAAAILFLRMHY